MDHNPERSWVLWHMPITQVLRRLRQEDQKPETRLGYRREAVSKKKTTERQPRSSEWLRGLECLLLLQRTHVQYPAPLWGV